MTFQAQVAAREKATRLDRRLNDVSGLAEGGEEPVGLAEIQGRRRRDQRTDEKADVRGDQGRRGTRCPGLDGSHRDEKQQSGERRARRVL
jgi:hypothetical protein